MLENLQAGRPMMGNQQQNGEMMQSLNQLGDMIRRQQQLMDQTHRAERGLGENGEPMTQEQIEEALRQLQQQQQGLGQSLSDLMKQLEGMGMQPGDGDQLGQAGEAMGRAAGDLGKGSPAAPSAIRARRWRRCARAPRAWPSSSPIRAGPASTAIGDGRQMPNEDPLGRPQRTVGPDLGTTVKVPDEIDIQRAREILDAIRKRLGDAGRPVIERDYLERLLDQF